MPVSCTFEKFYSVSLSVLTETINHMKLSSSVLDPISPQFFKALFEIMGPDILSIVNTPLINGVIPSCFKQAVISPLIKKPGLDSTDLNNFCPISKLPFLSKVLEKIVLSQITPYLLENDVFDQFGFRANHSTGMVILGLNYVRSQCCIQHR